MEPHVVTAAHARNLVERIDGTGAHRAGGADNEERQVAVPRVGNDLVLERGGVIRRTRGRGGGIFVAERKVERDLTTVAGLPAYLRRGGFQSDARVLSTATVEADADTAEALGLGEGALVLEVVRVRLADGEPLSLERALFPAERFPGLLDRSLGGSLYELLQAHYGLAPGAAEEHIEVVAAGTAEARLLELRRGAPLLAVARTAWDASGRPFERSHDLFRADRARMVVRSLPRQESDG